jgi:chromosome segregation ATPase
MTANQLAYAALQESSRHNLVGEEETNRHNAESERLTDNANQITLKLGLLADERDRVKAQIQKDYNDAYIAYLNASEEEKEWYESKMADLEDDKIKMEAHFRDQEASLKSQSNDIQAQMAENDRMYKEAWKDINYLNADLQNKRIEYEATLKREEMENAYKIQTSINALTEWRDTANYVLNMENTAQKWSDLRNQQEQLRLLVEKQDEVLKNLKADTNMKRSNTFKNYFSSIMDAINETAANGFRLFDMSSGGTYGKAKKAAEALFSD